MSCPLDAGQVEEPVCSLELLSPVKIIFTRARWSVKDLMTSPAYESREECGSSPANAKSPGGPSSEILVHDVHPEISAPGPQCRHFQCLHIMHEQRRVELQQCSCVHCTAVPKFAVQPTCGIQAAMSDPQHEEYFPQSSSSSQARLLEAASSSHLQASPHLPHSSWKKQAQKNLQSSR